MSPLEIDRGITSIRFPDFSELPEYLASSADVLYKELLNGERWLKAY